MFGIIKNWLTERDNKSWCLARILGGSALGATIYKFCTFIGEPNYVGFGTAVTSIISSLAFKYHVEGIQNQNAQ